jgi:hypothetical protein
MFEVPIARAEVIETMWASRFEVLLMNLRRMLPECSMNFERPDEALQQLREMTGEDFGYDCDKWEEWGRRKRLFYPHGPEDLPG